MLPTTEHRHGPITGDRRSQVVATIKEYRAARVEIARLEAAKRTPREDDQLALLQDLNVGRAKALHSMQAADPELVKLVAEGLRP